MFERYFPSSVPLLGSEIPYGDRVAPRHFGKEERHFRYLFSDIFHHHVTPGLLGNADELVVAPDGPLRLIQRDDLSALFRRKYISDFKISNTPNESSADIRDNLIPFEEFREQISAPAIRSGQVKPGSNHLSFLIGDVGHGKSLLMLKLLDHFRQPNPSGRLRCIPAYIDLEAAWGHEGGRFLDINEHFYEMLYERVSQFVAPLTGSAFDEFVTRHAPIFEAIDPISKLKTLCRWLPTQGFYLLLILDNIDRFHFSETRYSFFEEYKHKQMQSIERNFLRLFRTLRDEAQLGALSASIILSCRKTVFDHIVQCQDGSDVQGRWPDEYLVFQVIGIDVQEIVQKRLALMHEAISAIRKVVPDRVIGRYDHASSILEKAIRSVKAEDEGVPSHLLQYLHDLSHQGLRSFIDFVSRLELDSRDDCEVIQRKFVTRPRNLVRLYISNLQKRD